VGLNPLHYQLHTSTSDLKIG